MKTTMNAVKGYEINHGEETITITKKFNKAAGVYGSDEYVILMGLKKDWNSYKIVVREIDKNTKKVSYEGLTIYKMQAAVQIIAGEESAEEFQQQIKVYDGEKGKYATMKRIFLNSYKKAYQGLGVDEMAKVDELAKQIKEKTLEEREKAKKAEKEAKIAEEAAAREARRAKKEKALEAVAEDTKEATTPEATNVRKMSA